MKNYQYLTSGVLEAYLLGLTTDEEKAELEKILTTDPEVLAQLNDLETTIEDYFQRNGVPPPPSIREKIELRISETEITRWEGVKRTDSSKKAEDSQSTESPYLQVEISDTHIRVHKYWRTAFIAVFILSKVFLILGLYYYFKSASLADEVSRLKSATQQSNPLPEGRAK
ncbi:hypothetical protein [Spirosoma sp. KNUC1025]|uniref:hypothetical protein n=1 Tax=Spirosoma sp. KNUC1025 TaxID=2894082 RepID=UPI003863A3A6|nr:hypothetical protein LN737_08520 [Spirosoma sp. KNUC1025]